MRPAFRSASAAALLLALLAAAPAATALDLSVSQTDWSTTPSQNVTAGSVVNVFAKLSVDGGDLPQNVTTVLLVNGTAASWHNVTAPVSSGTVVPLWFYCVVPCGNMQMRVVVDPAGSVAETDETNNELSFTLPVRPCPDDGDADGGDTEQDAGVKSLYDYIPYVFIALVILVAAMTATAMYLIERRRRDEMRERERMRRYK